jgi:hypothetical protein
MQVVKRYPDGVFSWVDLGTNDTEGAKAFYGGLFGWSSLDFPTDSGMVYTLCQIEGHDVAGLGPLDPEMQAQGVPPFWTSYIKHDDVDAVAGRAAKAGGTVMMPPFDVMESGRMTIIQDPTGAMFGVWQPKEHIGAKAEKVQELGGNVLVPPTPAGEMGRFSVVQDPQGGHFNIIEYKGPADPPPGY